MARKYNSLSFTRNANKKALESEKKIASYVLFYDEEELDIFFKNFTETIRNSDFKLSKNMEVFIKNLQKIFNESPEIFNSIEKENFHPEIIINRIVGEVEIELSSEKEKESFINWIDSVETLTTTNPSDSESNFILGDDCCYYYFWNAFLDKVENINNSQKSYREKLSLKLPEVKISTERDVIKMSDVKENTFEKSIYTTGIEELDEYVNLLPKNLVYVAARPSVGKSMFVLNLAIANALKSIPSMYISLEMSPAQTKSRILTWIKNDEVDIKDIPILEASKEFKKIDEYFYMIDRESSNGEIILSYIDNFFKEYPDGIAILDSVNLVRFNGEDEWSSLRHISKSLKEIARKRDGIIICPCQASRSSETVGLAMDSLFGSTTLEQDADIIIGLEPNGKDIDMSPLKLKVIKNRDAMKDIEIDSKLNRATMHFYDSYNSN